MSVKCKLGLHDFGKNKYKVRKCYRCGKEVKQYDRRKNTYWMLYALQIIVVLYLFELIGVIYGLIASVLLYAFYLFGEVRASYKKVSK